jgi:hypothetical protein
MKTIATSTRAKPVRRAVASGRPRRRVARAKPFDPSKHLGAIRFKEDIDTVIRKMREDHGEGRG